MAYQETKFIFVFGSNTEGRHGKGAALYAKNHCGAIEGQAEGLQGNSYAIITKELRKDHPIVCHSDIHKSMIKFCKFAKENDHLNFVLSDIGTGLAGFLYSQIANIFTQTQTLKHNIFMSGKMFWYMHVQLEEQEINES